MKTYYHVLEHGLIGEIGYQNYFNTIEEAEKEVERLTSLWPDLYFTIYPSNTSEEPPIVNI